MKKMFKILVQNNITPKELYRIIRPETANIIELLIEKNDDLSLLLEVIEKTGAENIEVLLNKLEQYYNLSLIIIDNYSNVYIHELPRNYTKNDINKIYEDNKYTGEDYSVVNGLITDKR